MDNKCNHTNPYKRETEKDFITDRRGEGTVTMEANWNDVATSQEMAVATRSWKRLSTDSALGGNAALIWPSS